MFSCLSWILKSADFCFIFPLVLWLHHRILLGPCSSFCLQADGCLTEQDSSSSSCMCTIRPLSINLGWAPKSQSHCVSFPSITPAGRSDVTPQDATSGFVWSVFLSSALCRVHPRCSHHVALFIPSAETVNVIKSLRWWTPAFSSGHWDLWDWTSFSRLLPSTVLIKLNSNVCRWW